MDTLSRKELEEFKTRFDTMSEEELYGIISPRNYHNEDLRTLCRIKSISVQTLVKMLNLNKGLRLELVQNRKDIKKIYNSERSYYTGIAEEVMAELRAIRKDGYNKPLNLYEYYSNHSENIIKLANLVSSFHNFEGRSMIRNYLIDNGTLVDPLVKQDISSLKQQKIITCANETIPFTLPELDYALNDIEAKRMVLTKGTVHGALKKQKGI